jgi:putative intracellular protease/amidase
METPKTCYVYVLDTLADWEIGYVTAELHSGRYIDQGSGIVSLVKIGNSLKPVTTMGGMSITPDLDIESVDFKEGDILLLPGADTWFEEEQRKIIDMVAALLERKVVVAAICGATAALASKGLLNERKHTSNDKVYLKMVGPQYSG